MMLDYHQNMQKMLPDYIVTHMNRDFRDPHFEARDLDLFRENNKKLHESFETDYLYLPRYDEKNPIEWLSKFYANRKVGDREALIQDVFSSFDQLFSEQFKEIPTKILLQFFEERLQDQISLVREGRICNNFTSLADSPDAEEKCRFLLSQWTLDYLTEASPLTRLMAGSYGAWQTNLFKIVQDEYGSGILENKHSQLFSRTLNSVGMSSDLDEYRGSLLGSNYMYMNYVSRLCWDKTLFFRFLGFLFVYEAGLIDSTRQQGELLHLVFGDRVDVEYFSLHVNIDQSHGNFVLKEVIGPIVLQYGNEVAAEVLRGYLETLFLLNLFDHEIHKQDIFLN